MDKWLAFSLNQWYLIVRDHNHLAIVNLWKKPRAIHFQRLFLQSPGSESGSRLSGAELPALSVLIFFN